MLTESLLPAFAAAADFHLRLAWRPSTRRDGTLHGAAEFFVHRNQLLARPLARNLVADLSGNDVLPTCNIDHPNNGPLSQFCTMCPKQGIDWPP
jgi:hypothetical protein